MLLHEAHVCKGFAAIFLRCRMDGMGLPDRWIIHLMLLL